MCGVTERIAARPRPIPRDRSAMRAGSGRGARGRAGDELLGELEVGVGARAVRVVVDDRPPEARGLTDTDVPRDDRAEDEVGEVAAHLRLDVLREPGAPVLDR